MTITGIAGSGWLAGWPSSAPARSSQDGFQLDGFGVDQTDFVSTGRPGEYVDTVAGGRFVRIADALTTDDKALVLAATGGPDVVGAHGVHMVNQLAVTIALDRSMGNLTGPVTASYLERLRSSEQQTVALNQQGAASYMACGGFDQARSMASQGPGISFDVLDKALAYLERRHA